MIIYIGANFGYDGTYPNNFTGEVNAANNWPTGDLFCVSQKCSKIKFVVTTWANSWIDPKIDPNAPKPVFCLDCAPHPACGWGAYNAPRPVVGWGRANPRYSRCHRRLCRSLLVYRPTHLHSSNTPMPFPSHPQCWICHGWRSLTILGHIADPTTEDQKEQLGGRMWTPPHRLQ